MTSSAEKAVAVRVISMRSSADRRLMMQAQMSSLTCVEWSFFDALEMTSHDLQYDAAQAFRILRRQMTKGELGCFASHVALWKWFLGQDRFGEVVILEDDVVIDKEFFENLPAFLDAIPGVPYLRLYAKAPTASKRIGFIMGKHLIRYKGMAYGTQGYILRKPAAEKLVASIRKIVRPIDDEMDRYWIHGVPNIAIYPFPLMELSFPSIIGNARRAPVSAKVMDYLVWKSHRLYNSLLRRMANVYYGITRNPI